MEVRSHLLLTTGILREVVGEYSIRGDTDSPTNVDDSTHETFDPQEGCGARSIVDWLKNLYQDDGLLGKSIHIAIAGFSLCFWLY